jgi:hypothetical protein
MMNADRNNARDIAVTGSPRREPTDARARSRIPAKSAMDITASGSFPRVGLHRIFFLPSLPSTLHNRFRKMIAQQRKENFTVVNQAGLTHAKILFPGLESAE